MYVVFLHAIALHPPPLCSLLTSCLQNYDINANTASYSLWETYAFNLAAPSQRYSPFLNTIQFDVEEVIHSRAEQTFILTLAWQVYISNNVLKPKYYWCLVCWALKGGLTESLCSVPKYTADRKTLPNIKYEGNKAWILFLALQVLQYIEL